MSVQLAGSLSTGGPVTLTAQLSGATGYTLTGPAVGIATAPDGVFSVNLPGLYTISAINQGGCTITGTASVLPAEPPLIPDTFEPTNMLTCPEPGQPQSTAGLGAVANGTGFVFSGPEGYVFSNVFRMPGTYNIKAEGITQPGTYTLTVYNRGAVTGVYTSGITSDCTSPRMNTNKSAVKPVELRVTLSTDPTLADVVLVAVQGAAGMPVLINVVDSAGTEIMQKSTPNAPGIYRENLYFGNARGSFYLRITAPNTEKTVWLAR